MTDRFTSLLPILLKSEVHEMISHKPEETLHNCLRRHFNKVSQSDARKLAEQMLVPERQTSTAAMVDGYSEDCASVANGQRIEGRFSRS
jgi:hypothetical protein